MSQNVLLILEPWDKMNSGNCFQGIQNTFKENILDQTVNCEKKLKYRQCLIKMSVVIGSSEFSIKYRVSH